VTLVLSADLGIELAASSAVFPADLGVGAGELDNAGAYRALLGEAWKDVLDERGWRVDHPFERYGVKARQWLRVPGSLRSGRGEDTDERLRDVGDLAELAAGRCLRAAGIPAAEVGLVVAATSTPGSISASLASRVGRALGCSTGAGADPDGGDAPCMDVRAGGAGALQALLTGVRFLGERPVLIVAADAPSAFLDPEDLGNAMLYGDGAGAVLLARKPDSGESGLLGAVLRNTAAAGRPFTIPGPLPPDPLAFERAEYRVQPPDEEYAAGLLAARRAVLAELRKACPDGVSDATMLITNAATRAQAVAEGDELGLAGDQVLTTLERHGALGSASPLVALHECLSSRGSACGDTLALTAVGGGVSAAALCWRT